MIFLWIIVYIYSLATLLDVYFLTGLWWVWIVLPTWISSQVLQGNASISRDGNGSIHEDTTISEQLLILGTEIYTDGPDIPRGENLSGKKISVRVD
jgi:hypothetical protein